MNATTPPGRGGFRFLFSCLGNHQNILQEIHGVLIHMPFMLLPFQRSRGGQGESGTYDHTILNDDAPHHPPFPFQYEGNDEVHTVKKKVLPQHTLGCSYGYLKMTPPGV